MLVFVLIVLALISLMGASTYLIVHGDDSPMRPLSVGVFIATLFLVPYAFFNLLGSPVIYYPPIFTFPEGEYEIRGFALVPDEAIYLLVQQDPSRPPIYYKLPWIADQAKTLQDAENKGEGSHMVVRPNEDGAALIDQEYDILKNSDHVVPSKPQPKSVDRVIKGKS